MVHELMIKFVAIAGLAMLFLATTAAQEHDDARVTKVRAETEDSIAFEVSVGKKIYDKQEDIAVNYVVQNNSRRTIYLVTGPSTRIRFIGTFVVYLIEPVKGPNSHEAYDYELIKILPGRSYNGKLYVRAKTLIENKEYDFGVVNIQTGFAYLFDISNLGGCKENPHTLPCLSEIYNKSKPLTVGNLVVTRRVE